MLQGSPRACAHQFRVLYLLMYFRASLAPAVFAMKCFANACDAGGGLTPLASPLRAVACGEARACCESFEKGGNHQPLARAVKGGI